MASAIEQGNQAGFANYLSKPLDFDLLRACIAATLAGLGRPCAGRCRSGQAAAAWKAASRRAIQPALAASVAKLASKLLRISR